MGGRGVFFMHWHWSTRFAPHALTLADRHYNRQTPGSNQFMPPGRTLVLLTPSADALWGSSWQQYAMHAWRGAWNCSIFRNESSVRSSTLIHDAVAATRFAWGDPPALGMITFVDPQRIRNRTNPGYCYQVAGFRRVATTPKGLLVFQLRPEDFPAPLDAHGVRWRPPKAKVA